MMHLLIRAYQDSDWMVVSAIHDKARPIELKGSCDPRAFVPLAEDKDDLAEFRQSQKLVACLEDDIVGFVGIDGSDVGWLYVDPAVSGQGIGRRLLREALLNIASKATVYVLDGNIPALNLYRSEGFEKVSEFESQNNGYPCVVMVLSQL